MSPQKLTSEKTASTRKDVPELMEVLVALDATEHSDMVVQNLHRYLNPHHSICSFLHVLPQSKTSDKKFSALDEEAMQETVRIVNKTFDQYSEVLASHNFALENRVFIQDARNVEEGILHQVETQAPDILVLGMDDFQDRPRGWRIGSSSYAITTHAPCSVLVFKKPPKSSEKLRVLFAADASAQSQKAATDLMQFLPTENTEITLFSAVSVNYYILPMVEPYVNYTALEHAMKGEATQLLEGFREAFEKAGYTVTDAYFNLGDPSEQIMQEAQKNNIDLIVMGARGTGGRFTSWLLGSVSSRVLEYSETAIEILK